MPDLVLRTVRYHHPDAAALTAAAQQFYTQIYGSPDHAPVDHGEFAPPQGIFLVGYLDGEPVSMGGWRFTKDAPPGVGRAVELKRMFVRADVRRAGLALQTLRALEDSAAAAGAEWLILEAGLPQVAALAFYRRAGYLDIPRYGFYADYPNSVSLGKQLSAAAPPLRRSDSAALGAWLFKCNPRRRDFEEFLRTAGGVSTWCVARTYRSDLIRSGQPALLWVSGSGRSVPVPGLWAAGATVTGTYVDEKPAVDLRLQLLDDPVPREIIAQIAGMEDLEVLRIPAGSNPSWVTDTEFAALQSVLR